MFENFVTFTEVVKLSSRLFCHLKEINYHDKLLDPIYMKEDIVTFEEVINLVENKYLVTKFISILDYCKERDEKKWIETIFKVVEHIDITEFGNILLISSSENGLLNIVKYLSEHGADIHVDNDHPLVRAAGSGHLEVVKYLIEKGSDVNADDGEPLLWSVENNQLEVIKYLIERPDCEVCKEQCCHGAKVLPYSKDLLELASVSNDIEIIKYLIKKGADVTKINYMKLNSMNKRQLKMIHFLSGELLWIK